MCLLEATWKEMTMAMAKSGECHELTISISCFDSSHPGISITENGESCDGEGISFFYLSAYHCGTVT